MADFLLYYQAQGVESNFRWQISVQNKYIPDRTLISQGSSMLEHTYKPHYHYQNFSPLANGTDLNREKYAILQTHWH